MNLIQNNTTHCAKLELMRAQESYNDTSTTEVTAPSLFGGFSFRGLKELKGEDSWIHSTARKEHSKTEFGKKNSEKQFGPGEQETFYGSKFRSATCVTMWHAAARGYHAQIRLVRSLSTLTGNFGKTIFFEKSVDQRTCNDVVRRYADSSENSVFPRFAGVQSGAQLQHTNRRRNLAKLVTGILTFWASSGARQIKTAPCHHAPVGRESVSLEVEPSEAKVIAWEKESVRSQAKNHEECERDWARSWERECKREREWELERQKDRKRERTCQTCSALLIKSVEREREQEQERERVRAREWERAWKHGPEREGELGCKSQCEREREHLVQQWKWERKTYTHSQERERTR